MKTTSVLFTLFKHHFGKHRLEKIFHVVVKRRHCTILRLVVFFLGGFIIIFLLFREDDKHNHFRDLFYFFLERVLV